MWYYNSDIWWLYDYNDHDDYHDAIIYCNPMVIYSNGDYHTRSCPILDIQKCSKKNHPKKMWFQKNIKGFYCGKNPYIIPKHHHFWSFKFGRCHVVIGAMPAGLLGAAAVAGAANTLWQYNREPLDAKATAVVLKSRVATKMGLRQQKWKVEV